MHWATLTRRQVWQKHLIYTLTQLTKPIGMSAGSHDPIDWILTGNYALQLSYNVTFQVYLWAGNSVCWRIGW